MESGTADERPRRPGRHRKVDVAIPATRERTRRGRPPNSEKDDRPAPPKTKPPDFSEWHGFMSDFALKWICRAYVGYAFRGIEREKILSAKELEAIEPDPEMLGIASKPLAHMANRSKTLTKHGRFIVDSADGLESMIALAFWANTVRRIASSHSKERTVTIKPRKEKTPNANTRESSRQDVAEASSGESRSDTNGRFPGRAGNVPGIGG